MTKKIAIISSHASDIQTYDDNYENLYLLPFDVIINGEFISTSDLEEDFLFESIEKYQGENFPKTTIISSGEYKSRIEKIINEGYDTLLYIHTAPQLSGISNAVRLALEEIEGITYYMVNSKSVGVGLAAYIYSAIDLIDKGYSIDDTIASISKIHDKYTLYLLPKTLKYLVRGGRVSRPRYWLARILNIKPILSIMDGNAKPIDKARGIENARKKIKNDVTKSFSHDDQFHFIITHTKIPEVATEIFDEIKKNFPNSKGKIGKISPGMATHYGPGCLSMIAWDYEGMEE